MIKDSIFKLFVKDEGSGFHNLVITIRSTRLSITCDCGSDGLCEHRTALLVGDDLILFDKSQIDEFRKVQEFVKDSQIPKKVDFLYDRLAQIERNREMLANRETEMKQVFADMLTTGVLR